MGLLLALGSYIILQTINKDLLKTTFNLTPVTVTSTSNTSAGGTTNTSGYVNTAGNPGQTTVDPATGLVTTTTGNINDYSYLNSFTTDNNGNVHFTAYGYSGDLTPDKNSSEARGNNSNLLTTGSIALSPDLISSLQPQHGAAIYVGGTKVGYYDDSTSPSLTGRVDIYDPTASLGGNNFSKKVSGAVTIDNNDIRKQIPNP
jgi:hypothetical protein